MQSKPRNLSITHNKGHKQVNGMPRINSWQRR